MRSAFLSYCGSSASRLRAHCPQVPIRLPSEDVRLRARPKESRRNWPEVVDEPVLPISRVIRKERQCCAAYNSASTDRFSAVPRRTMLVVLSVTLCAAWFSGCEEGQPPYEVIPGSTSTDFLPPDGITPRYHF